MMTESIAERVKVWHWSVRAFHWSLVIAFTTAYITSGQWDDVHEWTGYVIAGLITFRLVLGLFGPQYARFAHFVHRPVTVMGYLRAMVSGNEPRHLGHNPAGGAMVVALLAGLAGTCLTGWLQTTDMFWGEGWLEEVHAFLGNFVLTLVVLHILGVILASLRHRENLARSMVTGYKRGADDHNAG